jgi:ribonuclease T1
MQTLPNFAAITFLAVMALLSSAIVNARNEVAHIAPEIPVSELPREAQKTLALIRTGGPFPYSRDGVVFANRERLLPAKSRGYYHEYTVKTPGSHNRGARRIICGGDPSSLADCYYTDDHYQSFRRIRS